MKEFIITEQELNQVATYLSKRPWNEVYLLMNLMDKLIKDKEVKKELKKEEKNAA